MNLLCGAGRVPFATYVAGTLMGVAPAIAVLSALGSLLRHTLLRPTVANGLATIAAAALLVAAIGALRALVLIRQFASAVSSHRTRAEFG